MIHCFKSTLNYSIFHWFYLPDLLIIDFEGIKKFISPIILILDEVFTAGIICKKIKVLIGSVENITIDGWKHWIDELFKIIADISLSLFPVCSYPILNGRNSTLIRSINRLILSKLGSEDLIFFSSSSKVYACSLECYIQRKVHYYKSSDYQQDDLCILQFQDHNSKLLMIVSSRCLLKFLYNFSFSIGIFAQQSAFFHSLRILWYLNL